MKAATLREGDVHQIRAFIRPPTRGRGPVKYCLALPPWPIPAHSRNPNRMQQNGRWSGMQAQRRAFDCESLQRGSVELEQSEAEPSLNHKLWFGPARRLWLRCQIGER